MDTTIIAVFVQFLVIILPMFGVHIGSDQLTVTIQTIATLCGAAWIYFQRVKVGDINAFGAIK